MAILVIFWSINGDRMDNLGLIDFKIGLYIKVTVNTGQNNEHLQPFMVHQESTLSLYKLSAH